MHFPQQKIIFIHIPKTGGNYFSRSFIHFSEDTLEAAPNSHQDIIDRFEIKGPKTTNKHQRLDQYQSLLGGDLSGYQVYTIARPPVERMLSLYFSPHRWMQRQDSGEFEKVSEDKIIFDAGEFCNIINKVPSTWLMLDAINCTQPLTLDRPIQHNSGAEIHLVPFDDIENRWKQFAKDEGFDGANFPGRRVNSSASPTLKDQMLKDNRDYLEDLIYATHHLKDLAFFE